MIAEPQFAPDRYERAVAAIRGLIEARGIGRHALFHEVGEGVAFPDGTESMSGYVVDAADQTYAFWTAWDAERAGPVFATWDHVELDPRLIGSAEYLEARAAVGLAPPPRGLTRPPGRRYVRWDGPDGVTRVIPEHTLEQWVDATVALAGAVGRIAEWLAAKIRRRL
jgi:hypothetical protein